jgi:hypothetical protein
VQAQESKLALRLRAFESLYALQTLLGVSVLGYSEQLVEIEAVALGGPAGTDSPPAAHLT